MASSLTPTQQDRYLAVLGVGREAPGRDALARLIRAHKLAVPFENTTAILCRHAHRGQPAPPIDPDALLDGWEHGAGGVCFELAEMFVQLLLALGYDAHRLFGRVQHPGDHQAVLVQLGDQRYLADVGSSQPVLVPVPLAGTVELAHAGIRMRFRPGERPATWLQEAETLDGWSQFFEYDLGEPATGVREEAYQRHHTPGYSFVVGSLVVTRCAADTVFQVRGGIVARVTTDGRVVTPVEGTADYERLLREVVGLPGLPVGAALAALADLQPVS